MTKPENGASPPKRQSSARQGSLSAETIVEAAIALLDEEGLDRFSMRNLARRLGVYPTALYWYVNSREALIRELIEAILIDMLPPDFEDDWKTGLLNLFRNYRQRIKRHPNVAPLIGAQIIPNIGINLAFIERVLAALQGAGFHGVHLRSAYNSVIATMTGYATLEFAPPPAKADERWVIELDNALNSIDPSEHPVTLQNMSLLKNASFIMRWDNGTNAPLDEGFELFINAQVRGLEQILADIKRA
jgi:Transcriptional regulator